MNKSKFSFWTLLILFITFSACMRPKSLSIVIVQSDSKIYAFGNPKVEFTQNGAKLNYIIPGAIVIFKVDYKILEQQGLSGEVYQISKDKILKKIGNIDTSMTNLEIVDRYMYKKDQIIADKEFVEIDLK